MTDYVKVFSSALQGMPRFAALARAVIGQVEDLIAVVHEMPAAFSLDQAVGFSWIFLGKALVLIERRGRMMRHTG